MKLADLVVFATLIALLGLHVRAEDEFSYKVGSEKGPDRWSLINKKWAACNSGTTQSPVDFRYSEVMFAPELGKIRRTYKASRATLINRGHDIQLSWDVGAGEMWLNGTAYTLKQLHWHSPSEHTLNGHRFPLELHMVHQSADGKKSVVGFVYEFGSPDAFLAELEEAIKKVKDVENAKQDVGMMDPRDVSSGTSKYLRYEGSLTAPPCTEGVVWTLITKVKTVSREQLRLLRDAVNDDMENNARPTQPLNGRTVYFYTPKRSHGF